MVIQVLDTFVGARRYLYSFFVERKGIAEFGR